MSMFCFQCQETARNTGCTVAGVCGKKEDTANLQDLLIFVLRGIAVYGKKAEELGISPKEPGLFIARSLFATITNANFDDERFIALIKEALAVRDELKARIVAEKGEEVLGELPDAATWSSNDLEEFKRKALEVGVLSTENEDVRSLRELLVIGLKGISAYADHAAILGFENDEIYRFLMEGLASTTKDLSVDEMVGLVLKAGETAEIGRAHV